MLEEEFKISKSLIELGLAQLARAVVEVTVDFKLRPLAAPLAVLDAISATEFLIRGSILESELKQHLKRDHSFSDLRLHELTQGSKRLAFELLPDELLRATGYSIRNLYLYREFGRIRHQLVRTPFEPAFLIENTLRFAYEVVEPIIIKLWNELIIAHAPEFEFDADVRVSQYLTQYKISTSWRTEDAEEDLE